MFMTGRLTPHAAAFFFFFLSFPSLSFLSFLSFLPFFAFSALAALRALLSARFLLSASSSCLFLPLCFFWRSADTFPFLQFPHSHHHHHHHHLQPGELSSVIMGVTVETTREGDKMTYPRPGDSVTMDYTGTLLDGTVSRCTTVMYLVQ